MPNRIAVKRLTKSDITFFAHHYHAQAAAGDTTAQKSINLNREVFIDRLYPGMDGEEDGIRFPVALFGPDGAGHVAAGVMVKKSQKNWRLNGFVRDPAEAPERFTPLRPGDLVVMDFVGDDAPRDGRLCFVCREEQAFLSLNGWLGGRAMASLDRATLAARLDADDVPADHPLRAFALNIGVAHAEMRQRLDALEKALAALADLPPPAAGLGHNQPPEPIEDEPLTAVERQEVAAAVAMLKEQPPGPSEVSPDTAGVVARLGALAAKVGKYLAAKADVFVTEAVKSAGSETGKWAVRLPLWGAFGASLLAAAHAAEGWLRALGH